MSLNKSEALRIAEQRIHQGQTSEAIAIYKKIIEADPFDLTTIGALSNLYVKTGRIQDAIDDFSRIADGYLDKGSPIKSAYILKKILELDPRNAPAHMRLGEIYAHEGMSEKAYEAFLAAGALFTKKGNLADALEANKKALAVKPDSQQATAAIAALQSRAASSTSERLSSSSSDDPEQRDRAPKPVSTGHTHAGFDDGVVVQKLSMAEFLVSYGKVEQAIELLKEILDHRPDHIDVRVKLKDIYLRSEMMGKASSECFEIASIYAARGDAARARDYTVRAERLTQLFKQTDSLRGEAFDKDEPQASSSKGGALTGKAKPETSGAASKLQSIKEQAASSQAKSASNQESAALNQKRAASNQGQASLKAAPVAVAIQSPAAPLKLVVEKTELAEPSKVDKLEMHAGDTALALVTKEERSLAMVTNSALVVSNSFPLTTLGILSAQPVVERATKKKGRRWLYAAMIAFAVLAAIAVAIFKGARIYEARLDREYQTLEQAISLPSLPQPTDSATVEGSEPVEQVEVRASDSPSPQPNKPVRPDEETQPTRNAETQPQPSPSVVTASEPPKVNKPSSPAPPLISSTPSPQGGGESAAPGGVPTGMPASTAGLPEPPPPPAAASRKPGAVVRGESIKQVQPDYPPLAKSTGQSGVVAVEVTISEKGDVISARALSGPPLLRDAAVSAAKRWKFKPSMRDSKPVASVSTISFKFTM